MPKKFFAPRRVVALATTGQKLYGLTVSDSAEANGLLLAGVILFGRIKQNEHGFTLRQKDKRHTLPLTAEPCYFPEVEV